jgi:predicted RNA-binding protein YlqC (UPF0109 family)
MSLNNSVPPLTEVTPPVIKPDSEIEPDYIALVRYLLEPLLESPKSLKVDCESLGAGRRILLRVAFETEDKGRAFGRGGRNVQAVRTVLQTIGQLAQHQVHLEVFGGQVGESELEEQSTASGEPRRRSRPSSRSGRPANRPRTRRPQP